MSQPRLLLAVSLIFNVILVAWAALPDGPPAGARNPAAVGTKPPASGLAAWFAKIAPSRESAPPATPQTVPDADYSEAGWTRSLYDDVAELREHGFDDATVRMLALAEAERLFRERAQAVLAPQQRADYWQPRNRMRIEPAQLAAFQRLRREKIAAIAELVGPDAASTERNTPHTFMAGPLQTLGYLPSDKRLALSEHLETADFEFSGGERPFTRMRRSVSNAANHAEHELARDAQIRVILGPELYYMEIGRASCRERV